MCDKSLSGLATAMVLGVTPSFDFLLFSVVVLSVNILRFGARDDRGGGSPSNAVVVLFPGEAVVALCLDRLLVTI